MRIEDKAVLLAIDYHTRFVIGKEVDGLSADSILNTVKEWCNENKPEEFVTDNGKEFANEKFRKYCQDNKIKHHMVSVESHNSNGRIERVIRTIREGMMKNGDPYSRDKLDNVIGSYNNSFHKGLGMSPLEAIEKVTETIVNNSRYGKYAEAFRRRKRYRFQKGQKVAISQTENLKNKSKQDKGRFLVDGVIIEVLDNDSYLVRKDTDGKIVKKRYFNLKSLDGMMRLPSRGGDVIVC